VSGESEIYPGIFVMESKSQEAMSAEFTVESDFANINGGT
jgi:hypothetical protein